jgi:hypothetical protein
VPAGPGFISRIARHPRSAEHEERENRLTEVCAAIFDSAPCAGLAHYVVAEWLRAVPELASMLALLDADADTWSCQVRTQFRITVEGRLRQPDLLLTFTRDLDDTPQQVDICVEVKHGTEPHDHQLHDYVKWLDRRPSNARAVVLIASRSEIARFRDSEIRDEIPETVPCLSWQQTAAIIDSYERRTSDPVSQYLVRQLCVYLKEENLMDPDQLTPAHMIALANHKEALTALNIICDEAAAVVASSWPGGDWRPKPFKGPVPERWWRYPLPETQAEDQKDPWDFGWHLFLDSDSILRDGRAGAPCFLAGVAGDATGRIGDLSDGNVDTLRSKAFHILPEGATKAHKREYIWRVAYPEDVLAGPDVAAQGRALARWITAALDELRAVLGADGPQPDA